jgi:hypothetical protein
VVWEGGAPPPPEHTVLPLELEAPESTSDDWLFVTELGPAGRKRRTTERSIPPPDDLTTDEKDEKP